MDTIPHWLVSSSTTPGAPFVVFNEESAAGYAAVTDHWHVEGPFVLGALPLPRTGQTPEEG